MSEKRVLDMPAETDKKPKMTSEEKIEAGKIELQHIPAECTHNAHMFYLKCKNLEERT